MVKDVREFTNNYTLGDTIFKWIHFVQSVFSPCTFISTTLRIIGWWQIDVCDHLSCQTAVSFFNAIFLTSAHFFAGYGLRETALIAITEWYMLCLQPTDISQLYQGSWSLMVKIGSLFHRAWEYQISDTGFCVTATLASVSVNRYSVTSVIQWIKTPREPLWDGWRYFLLEGFCFWVACSCALLKFDFLLQ